MAKTANYVAIDIGAETGRCFVGSYDGEHLALKEIYRFPNRPVRLINRLHWDALYLYSEIKTGISRAVKEYGPDLAGFGLDTWGVDFALLDRQDELVGNPYHYRDNQTEGMLSEAFHILPQEELYRITGIQFMRLNTLYQLLAMKMRRAPQLEVAKTLLMVPDLFNYWLTGRITCEYTNASTTQMLDASTRHWSGPLIERMGLPVGLFIEMIQPGSVVGNLLPEVAEETGARGLPVIAVATHDNASAVASVSRTSHCYISSGTWSVVGAELDEPVINDKSYASNFTNEGGVCGTISLFKNVTGLWLLQESRRTWIAQGNPISYDEICQLAMVAPAFTALIDPDAPEFLTPGNMIARIQGYCRGTGQVVPESYGNISRVIFEGLALKYRWVFTKLEEIMGRRLDTVQIIGGGSQNLLLNQFVANALNRPVIAGPVEATTLGNLLMQLLATEQIASLEEGRAMLKTSFKPVVYTPQETAVWDEAYPRFEKLIGSVLIG